MEEMTALLNRSDKIPTLVKACCAAMENKEIATVEHVKGSEITGAWARDLDIKSDCHYEISVKLDNSPTLSSIEKRKRAIEQIYGLWEDRGEIQEEMARLRRDADRY